MKPQDAMKLDNFGFEKLQVKIYFLLWMEISFFFKVNRKLVSIPRYCLFQSNKHLMQKYISSTYILFYLYI